MAQAPCGCLQLERLRTSSQQSSAGANEHLARIARRHQEGWRCPGAGHKADRAALKTNHLFVLSAVQNYTKLPAEQCDTCPVWYAGTPLAKTTLQAYKWREKGSLHVRHPHPPASLLAAIDVLDAAISAQEHEANERFKRRLEKSKKERKESKK